MRRLLLLLALLSIASPVLAQDIPPEGCSAADYAALLSTTVEALAKSDAHPEALLADLIAQLQAQRAACAGLTFSGDTNEILGPFDVPAGDYIVEAVFTYAGTVTFESLTDDCVEDFQYEILASSDVAGETDSFILRTGSDCTLLVDVGTDRSWTLAFTPVQ